MAFAGLLHRPAQLPVVELLDAHEIHAADADLLLVLDVEDDFHAAGIEGLDAARDASVGPALVHQHGADDLLRLDHFRGIVERVDGDLGLLFGQLLGDGARGELLASHEVERLHARPLVDHVADDFPPLAVRDFQGQVVEKTRGPEAVEIGDGLLGVVGVARLLGDVEEVGLAVDDGIAANLDFLDVGRWARTGMADKRYRERGQNENPGET